MAYRTEIEKLEQRYAENPKQWFAALADAYRKQGDVDLAIEYVKGGIEERPDYASAHIVLGRCYLDKDLDEDAGRSFEQVLDLDAENIVALKALEEIAERKGDTAGARLWLTRLLEVDPMNEDAHENLARLDAEEKAQEPSPEAEGLAPEAVDPSSVEVEPMMLDATMPLDGEFGAEPDASSLLGAGSVFEGYDAAGEDEVVAIEPLEVETEETTAEMEPIEIETADTDSISLLSDASGYGDFAARDEDGASAIAPFEIETEDSDAISLLSAEARDDESAIDDGGAAASIGSIELDTTEADANALLAGMQESSEFLDDEDDGPVAELEPLELETPAEDANSLLARVSEEAESPDVLEETKSEFGAIGFDMSDGEGRVTVAGEAEAEEELEEVEGSELSDEPEAVVSPDEIVAEIDSADHDEAADDVGLSVMDIPDELEEIELADEGEETDLEMEVAAEIVDTETVEAPDEDFSQRLSVPPTKEVDAVDLESMRAVDELIARPTIDAPVVDYGEFEPQADAEADFDDDAEISAEVADEDEGQDDEVESVDEPTEDLLEEVPRTREIDAVELEQLRVADALVVGSTAAALIPDEVEEDDSAIEADGEPETLVESGWDVEDIAEVKDADEADEKEDVVEEETAAIPYGDVDVLPLIMPEEAGEDESDSDAEPEPVVTETMAEVYAKQGLYEQAREIYEVLVMQHADDSRLKARLNELNEQANSAMQETRQSRFSVAVTGGESTVVYLQRIFAYEGDGGAAAHTADLATVAEPEAHAESEGEMARTPLEQAFADDPPEVRGEPMVVAADDVSLESVFDGGAPEPASTEDTGEKLDQASDEPESEGGVSFDEFYGSEPRLSSPDASDSSSDDEPADDDDSFKDWLKGLKT